jgi:hypothetical protein
MIGESHLTTACSEPEATIPPTPPPLASLYRLMYNVNRTVLPSRAIASYA